MSDDSDFSSPKLILPVARKEPHVVTLHGSERSDDYFWLRRKDSHEVLEYLRAEKAYTEAVMQRLEPLQKRLYDELLSRIKEDDQEVPYKKGDWLWCTRTEKGKGYPIHFRKKVAAPGDAAPPEQVVLDLNQIGAQEKYVGLGVYEPSDDANLLAYSIDTTGFGAYTLRFRDLRIGQDRPERIEYAGSVAWAKNGESVFYTVEDPGTKRSHKLFRHVLGTDPAGDTLLYQETDERFHLTVYRSRSAEYIFLGSESMTTTEWHYLRADTPEAPLTVFAPREHDHEYFVAHRGDQFIIRTNSAVHPGGSKARNFRICTAELGAHDRGSWKEVVGHREEVMIGWFQSFKEFTVLFEIEDANPQIRIIVGDEVALEGSHRILFPEPLFDVWSESNPEYDQPAFRLSYSSPVTPPTVYDYRVASKELTLLKRLEVPGGYDPGRYRVRRVHAKAQDGTNIPVSLLLTKDTEPDGTPPMLLYGYGSYGIENFVGFSSHLFSLVDRGVVYAVAHIRGGGELGKRWHEEGRMLSKINTFTDFVACAEALLAQGWAAKEKIVIQGASAGGLLMGAVTNLRPDLWRGVVAQVPFVDVINTMLDESVPLTVTEFEEWGNPKHKLEYDSMMKYSPYDNLAAKDYPPILVETSYNDSAVMYWEPAKYVAKLRSLKTDSNPLLLKVNLEPAGHGGRSGRYDHLKEIAFTYSWILWQLGLAD